MMDYNIIEAEVETDKEKILTILMRNLDVPYSEQRYYWNYKQCPYGRASCWLARLDSSNSFIGSASLFPRMIQINQKSTRAAILGDFSVDKDHRGYGPALKLQKEILFKVDHLGYGFTYGIPNKRAKPILMRIGYKKIGEYAIYIKLLKTETISKENLPRYFRSRMFLRILDFFNSIYPKEKRIKNLSGYSIEMPILFDERFDALWVRASKQFIIIGERSSKFLNWRYKQIYNNDYKIFCILNDKKELCGYIVYSIKNNICNVFDLLFLPSDNLIDFLFGEFFLHLREMKVGAVVLRYMGNDYVKKKLNEFNFFKKSDDTVVVLHSIDFSPESFLLNENNWYFFAGDSDI